MNIKGEARTARTPETEAKTNFEDFRTLIGLVDEKTKAAAKDSLIVELVAERDGFLKTLQKIADILESGVSYSGSCQVARNIALSAIRRHEATFGSSHVRQA